MHALHAWKIRPWRVSYKLADKYRPEPETINGKVI